MANIIRVTASVFRTPNVMLAVRYLAESFTQLVFPRAIVAQGHAKMGNAKGARADVRGDGPASMGFAPRGARSSWMWTEMDLN